MSTFSTRLYVLLVASLLSWTPTYASSPPVLSVPDVDRANPASTVASDDDLLHQRMSPSTAKRIRIVFSDVDGTLVHYPSSDQQSPQTLVSQDADAAVVEGRDNAVLELPPSATGTRGVISCRTLRLCREIRHRKHGGTPVRLVLVSGMRTSTLLQRLPYLPRADVYCSEGGSRIFYPVILEATTQTTARRHRVVPVPFEGATADDLQPFEIEEDEVWRHRIIAAVGDDGYYGNEIERREGRDDTSVVPVDQRKGPLWDFAKHLTELGYVIDTKGYAACFRINRKQQPESVDFDALLQSDGSAAFPVPPELGTSTNLGCVDIYSAMSGKKNCCLYLAERFCGTSNALKDNCVCLCDDDNDLEMAMANRHAFIPSISSTSMTAAIEKQRDQFTVTSTGGMEGTIATEVALERVLDLIQSENAA